MKLMTRDGDCPSIVPEVFKGQLEGEVTRQGSPVNLHRHPRVVSGHHGLVPPQKAQEVGSREKLFQVPSIPPGQPVVISAVEQKTEYSGNVFRVNQQVQIIEASRSKVAIAKGGQNRTLDSQRADPIGLEFPAHSDQFTNSYQISKVVVVVDLRQPVLLVRRDTGSVFESPCHKGKQPRLLGPLQEAVPSRSEPRLLLNQRKGRPCRCWGCEIEQYLGQTRIRHL